MTLFIYTIYILVYGCVASIFRIQNPFDGTALIALAVLAAGEGIRMSGGK